MKTICSSLPGNNRTARLACWGHRLFGPNARRIEARQPARCARHASPNAATRTFRHPGGFTLVELLVTLALLGLLAGLAAPLAETVERRGKERDLRAALRTIRDALDAYKAAADAGRIEKSADESGYPPSLGVLVAGVVDRRAPAEARVYFLRRLPRDPLADPALPADQSWGLRSYASPPDEPKPGKDVFDVYSLAPGKGLDGVSYREW
jgi:general secretion pathway protein G